MNEEDKTTQFFLDEDFQEIENIVAKTHGVLLSKDDPLMIHYTLNKIMMQQNITKFSAALKSFKEEMALQSQNWNDVSSKSADLFIKLAVKSQQNTLDLTFEEFQKKIRQEFALINDNTNILKQNLENPIRTLVSINLIACLVTLCAVLVLFYEYNNNF